MNAKVETVYPKGRIIAISDIHGHGDLLADLLEKVGFCQRDFLVIVGDVVEKGPQSLKALRLVMQLAERENVRVLTGNVDLWRYYAAKDDSTGAAAEQLEQAKRMTYFYGSCLFTEFCGELNLPWETEEQVQTARLEIRQAFKKELDFLGSRPTAVDAGDYLFVHGGVPSADLSALGDYDEGDFLKVDNFRGRDLSFDKFLVVGHWPVVHYYTGAFCHTPFIDREKKIISIDGGCGIKDDGQLNAFIILPNDKFSHTFVHGLPQKKALDAQAATREPMRIMWPDNGVVLLERREDLALVRHNSTGKELEIPSAWLFKDPEGLLMNDYTDYRVEVKPGDMLGIVVQCADRTFVKAMRGEESVSGWYFGRLE